MKLKATLKILGETQSGISQATGNPWACKEIVFAVEEGEYTHNISAKTFNKGIIDKLAVIPEGTKLEIDVRFSSTARKFQSRKTGEDIFIRQTECTIVDLISVEPF